MSGEMVVIGIDPGTNGGWVAMRDDLRIVAIGPKSGDLYHGHHDSYKLMRLRTLGHPIDYAFIEQQFAGRLSSDALRLGKSEGFWAAFMQNQANEIEMINPNAWRTYYKLHKQTSRQVFLFTKQRFGTNIPEHCATAALIAGFGIEKYILGNDNA